MGEDEYDPPIILGRPFLHTVKAIIVDIWERNKELIRKRTDIGQHFTREVIQSIVFIFFTTRIKSASD